MAFEVDEIILDGQTEGLKTKFVVLDFGVNGIYGHSSSNYSSVPIQVLVPKLDSIDTFTKIEAKLCLSYNTEGTATMDARMYDFTDGTLVTNSAFNLPNETWTFGESGWVDITLFQGKALRVQTKRNGGAGSNDVSIEGACIILKYS